MFRKLGKIIGSLALALAVFFSSCTAAFAAESTIDWSRTGAITVTPKSINGDHPVIKGSTFTLYRVAAAASVNANLSYTLTEAFSGSKADLSDLNTEGLAKTLSDYADAQKLSGTVQGADSEGTVKFSNLELGLYLLVQTGAASGSYAADPFLVSIPMTSEDGSEWLYDVDASPKAEVYEVIDLTVRKVWNDGGSTSSRPASVSVTLYQEGNKVDNVTLNEKNHWQYTWKDLKKSDSYSVKESEISGYAATYTKTGNEFTITNTSKLAQTGQLNWPVPLLAGCGVLLFALGWILVNAKKNS